jgi:hypothetical protein
MKFADQYPEANFRTCPNGPEFIVTLAESGAAPPTRWGFNKNVELWIDAEMSPCYNDLCRKPTRFYVYEITGTRHRACSMECASRAAMVVD